MHDSTTPFVQNTPALAAPVRVVKSVAERPDDKTQKPGDFICVFESIEDAVKDAAQGLPQLDKKAVAARLLAGLPLKQSRGTYQRVDAPGAAKVPEEPAPAVETLYRIPQLEWQDFGNGRWRGWVRELRLYRVTVGKDGGVRWWRYEDHDSLARRVDVLGTAQAFCQRDFEKRTAAILEPVIEGRA